MGGHSFHELLLCIIPFGSNKVCKPRSSDKRMEKGFRACFFNYEPSCGFSIYNPSHVIDSIIVRGKPVVE